MGKKSREKQFRRMQEESAAPSFSQRRPGLENFYFKAIEWLTYVSLFTPLVFVRAFFFPYVVPKTIFFRIAVDIIVIFYVLLVITNKRYLPKFNALTIALTVFLAITVLTSITGVNFERSFWSTFERMTGLLTFFHLYAFFIILISVFKERKYWERILTAAIFVSIFICFYLWNSAVGPSRGGATLGNTSFLSAYLIFGIFFAIILFLSKKGWWKIFYAITLIPLLIAMFFNIEPTRGAIGAFFISLLFFALSFMFFSGSKALKRAAPFAIVLVVLLGSLIIQTGFFKQHVIDIKDVPGRSREIVWQIGWKGWQDKFWLGWGQENFNIPYAEYYSPELPLTFDLWYDRVHNIVLDTAVTSGTLGLASYLAVFLVAIWGLFKAAARVVERRNTFIPLGMAALLTAYFIQDIWVFDMISSYMMFFLTLAFVNFIMSPGREGEPALEKKYGSSFSFAGAALIVLSLFTLWFGNIQPAKASNYTVIALASPLENAIPLFEKGIEASPMAIFETPEQFSKKITGFTFDETQDRAVLAKGFELAALEIEESLKANPDDFRLFLMAGRHYNDYFHFSQDPSKLQRAEELLVRAEELSPRNQQVFWSLAQTKVSQGKTAECIEIMQKSVDLEPRYGQSHWFLAMAYNVAGDYESALKEIKTAEEMNYNWKGNLADLQKVIGIYQNLREDEELVPLYRQAIELAPEDAQYVAGLAVALANTGRYQEAREMAEKAIEMNSDYASQFKDFLNELPSIDRIE